LLRQRRRALRFLALDDVRQCRAQDAFGIDAAVPIELRVLGGHDGLHEQRRHVLLRHDDALLDRVLGEWHAVPVIDARDDGRLIVGQLLDLRHPHGVREQETSRNPEHGRREQHQQNGLSSRWRGLGDELVLRFRRRRGHAES